MNNVTAKILPLVALMLLVSGCLCGGPDSTTTNAEVATTLAEKTATTQPPETTQPSNKPVVTTTVKSSGGLVNKITSLAEAMTAGAAMRCTYTYKDIQSQSWVKGQKMYSETTMPQGTAYSLSDGTWMYSWMSGQKQGVKFNIAQMKSMSDAQEKGYTDPTQVSQNAANVACVPDVAADSKFIAPSGIEFQDMGKLLEQMKNGGAGGNTPNIPDLSGYGGE
jgi:hypothetical protein